MKVPFMQLLGRLTGISTPIFGVSWNPPESDKVVAERVITFLEDRRVLLPYALLINYFGHPNNIIHSISGIRSYLTSELQKLDRSSELFRILDAMRKLCRNCLDVFELAGTTTDNFSQHVYWPAVMEFKIRMGQLITTLAVGYGIDLSEDFTQELPTDLESNSVKELENNHKE